MNAYNKLTENEHKLLESAPHFLHLVHSFVKSEQLTNFVNVWILENSIQMLKTVTWGSFQIYFYKNIFIS